MYINIINIKSCSEIVSDLWSFEHPMGYNGKNSTLAQKSRKEDAVTLFLVCLVVLASGIHRSDMVPLGPVTSTCATPANRQTDGQTLDVRLCEELLKLAVGHT